MHDRNKVIIVNNEPGVKENPEFPFKNLSVLKHVASESSTEKTPLEKALTEDTKSSIDRALQDELNRIYAAELKNKE